MRCVTLLVLGAAACGGSGGPGAPDGGGSNDPDAPVASGHGITIQWSAKPALPGTVHGDVTVTSALFRASYLEVIGDAGPDLHTTAAVFALRWDADGQPEPIVLDDAPAGLYSRISMRLDGVVVPSYEIEGTAKVDGQQRAFEILDLADIRVSIDDIGATLAPGGGVIIPIQLSLEAALGSVNFGQLPQAGGVLELAGDDPQLEQFRDKITTAFTDRVGAEL
jgi:hypothetical protein